MRFIAYIPLVWFSIFNSCFFPRGMKPFSSISLRALMKMRHTYEMVEKAVTFYKLTSNWSGFLFCVIACKKKRFRRRPRSMSDEFVEIRHWIRQWSAGYWSPVVRRRRLRTTGVASPHRLAQARAVPSDANRASTVGSRGGWTRPLHSRVDASSISNDEDETYTRIPAQTGG